MANDNNNREPAANSAKQQPTHIAKMRIGRGETANFERIGVAWAKEDGSVYIKLHGTQIVSDGFTLYPASEGGAR